MFPPFSKQPLQNIQNSSLNICCNDDYLDLLFDASLPLDQVCYAFAYGSGAVPQKGENQKEKMEFLHKIVGLSYKGDVRMGWAEDSRKIDKLVEGANEQLRMHYIPLLKNDKQILVINDEMIEQDNSIQTVFHRLQMLPYFVQRGLCNSYYPSRRN
uniref:Phosphatidate cytidylyltransferase, mitochondrial n=1 Tax=Meloidogyne floridensis TaxID=298350 RepID=A0A915NS45_9BILA